MQWDFHWNLGTFLGILELTWPPMAQARGGLGVSKMCCSRGLVSHLIGGTGIAMVKPEQRERDTHTRETHAQKRGRARKDREGRKAREERRAGARRVGRAKKVRRRKASLM